MSNEKFINKITCCDCLEGMKQMDDESVDLIVTDPPYGINYQSNMRKEKFDKVINDDNLEWVNPTIKELNRILKNNAAFYCFTRWDVYCFWYNEISKYFKIRNCLIVPRRKRTFGGDLKSSFSYSYDMVIYANKGKRIFENTKFRIADNHSRHGEKPYKGYVYRYEDLITDFVSSVMDNAIHPTQKTIEINTFFISLSSKENDLILDPFMGSGTTAVACKQLNRNFIGFEINPEYVEIANKRLEQENLNSFL